MLQSSRLFDIVYCIHSIFVEYHHPHVYAVVHRCLSK